MPEYKKIGYLTENYKIFHIKDQKQREFHYHYHDFHKILILLRGDVTYYVEGRSYPLLPDDIVLISAGEVHRPVVNAATPYERIILYISPDYLEKYSTGDYNLMQCFPSAPFSAALSKKADAPLLSSTADFHEKSHVLRLRAGHGTVLKNALSALDQCRMDLDYASTLLQESLFLQFMIYLNRAALHKNFDFIPNSPSDDKTIAILSYLNEHLTEPLSIDSIASHFFLNRYYLMHMFKVQTGYTIGNYIETKRLELARELILSDAPALNACESCGFVSYSSFSRAYKKKYGHSPREDRKLHGKLY